MSHLTLEPQRPTRNFCFLSRSNLKLHIHVASNHKSATRHQVHFTMCVNSVRLTLSSTSAAANNRSQPTHIMPNHAQVAQKTSRKRRENKSDERFGPSFVDTKTGNGTDNDILIRFSFFCFLFAFFLLFLPIPINRSPAE